MHIQRKRLFFCICFVIGLLFACQPTPKEDAVRQKSFNKMFQMAKKPADSKSMLLREQVQAPERYMRQITGANNAFMLCIDAYVEIPNHEKMPIAEIAPIDFSQEQTRLLYDLFCRGKEMYIVYPDAPLTKAQIESKIRFLMQEITEMEEIGNEDDPYVEECRADLSYLQTLYPNAPEISESVQCHGALMRMTEYSAKAHSPVCSYTWVTAQAEELSLRGEPRIISFSVTNRNDLDHAIQVDGEWFFKRSGALMSYTDMRNHVYGDQCPRYRIENLEEVVDVPFTPRQAEEAAQSFLCSVGLEQQLAIDSVWLYRIPKDDSLFSLEEHPYSYEVRLSRLVEGIPCAYDRTAIISEYMDMWQYEQIALVVDEEGIISFHWFSPVKVTTILQEDVNLLPFEQIMERFEAQVNYALIPFMQGYVETEQMLSQRYDINRITLSLQRVNQPNNFDSALLVPVWSFYGTKTEVWENEDSLANVSDRELACSLITINAIDGTIINLQEGY